MARKAAKGKQVADYRHEDAKRVNNPPAGLAWQDTEKPPKRRFEYDPHLDPQLVWAGKAERQSFEVEAPSIHVHERLSADDILRSVMKEPMQPALFDYEELDRSKVVDFYRHEMGWENRLILGDSLVVMASLLEKERLGGQVQMVYIDPPYGISYNSNFQPRISSRRVTDGNDGDLTREPEQIQAFRDTWELRAHSYLTYLRDRLLLARELLSDRGSVFVQIGEDNVHRARLLLDEVFRSPNFCSLITYATTSSAGSPSELRVIPPTTSYLLWYAKDKEQLKYRPLYQPKSEMRSAGSKYVYVELPSGDRRRMTNGEISGAEALAAGARIFRLDNLTSQSGVDKTRYAVSIDGREFKPSKGVWKTSEEGMKRLLAENRVMVTGNTLSYVRYLDDFEHSLLSNLWPDVSSGAVTDKRYVVQTSTRVVERCVLMTTDPGDLIVDPTSGSGTTAYVAEQWGRRWIAVDTSRVATAVARERLLTTNFPYYKLIEPERGVDGGFLHERLSRVTLRSIARGQGPEDVVLVDQPQRDGARVRVCGPFTVEALSRYAVNPNQENVPVEPDDSHGTEAQDHVATLLDALEKHGIPRKGARPLRVEHLEPTLDAGAIHAYGHCDEPAGSDTKAFAVSIGPRFGPITVQQVEEALHDAHGYAHLVVFAGYAATAEAQEYVAKGKIGRFEVALLEANPDLLVSDLLKQTPSSQTFRLFAAPDVTGLPQLVGISGLI